MKKSTAVLALQLSFGIPLAAQTTPLLRPEYLRAIREESSGELALSHFRHIVTHYSGFTPSKGGDQVAEYLADRARANGLSEVAVEGFPADGKRFFWTWITEPSWDAEAGTLTMKEPRVELLADLSALPIVLGRFSASADLTTELVDVGAGVSEADYQDKNVRGKLVLVSGEPGAAHAAAVWRHGAAGIVAYRPRDGREPLPLVANPTLVPWSGPNGESPGVAFGVPFATALDLRELLRQGKRVVLEAKVRATTGPGEYKQVSGVIPGTDPSLAEVWVNAHDNWRNTGGGNNLTGVGATVEMARVLATLVNRGALPRPRRTIRFLWGAEHFSSIYNFYRHPDKPARILTFLNVDMVGYHQERAKSVFHLYRTPHSLPHFINDVAEEFLTAVGRANAETVRDAPVSAPVVTSDHDPVFAPTGSRDQLHYGIEEFWGPSDHEDAVTLGVPAVLYNDWPDPWIGTQEDDIDRADPTQMRRAILTIASTAYYLASVTPAEAALLARLMTAAAQARMARDFRQASLLSDPGGSVPEATNLLERSFERERATLLSLLRLGESPELRAAVSRAEQQLNALHGANFAAITGMPTTTVATRTRGGAVRRPPALTGPGAIVPARTDSIKGPVHFFRPEYGFTWLRRRTGTDTVQRAVKLAARGHYVLLETLNFADGKRNLGEIRDAVSAEYGPIPLEEIEQYFRFLERVGVVTLKAGAQ